MTERIDDTRRTLLGIGLVLAVSLVAFETTAVITALPTITDELHGDSLYGATLSAYMLADIVALVASAELVDRRGLRTPFVGAAGLFIAGLVVSASAPSMAVVLLGRVLQGAGTGALSPISYTTVKRVFPSERQPTMYAWLSAGWVLPSLLAPAAAGVITDHLSWRWVFLAMLPMVAVVAGFTWWALAPVGHTPPRQLPGFRFPKALQLAVGVGAVVFGLQERRPWLAVPLVGLGVIIALPAFRRLTPAGTMRARPGLPAIIACRFLATAMFLSADSFIPLAADRIHGVSPVVQGFVIVGAAVAWSGGAMLSARRTIHVRRAVLIGFVLLIVGVASVAPVLDADWPLAAVGATWAIAGLGMGLLFNPTTVAAMTYAEPGHEGMVAGQLHLADSLGFGLMGGVGGATVAVADRTSLGLGSALATNFGLAIVCGLVGVYIARRTSAAPVVREPRTVAAAAATG